MDLNNFISPVNGEKLILENDKLKGKSKKDFPVVKGIPRFVDSKNFASSFGVQWNKFRKTQLDSHTGTTITEDRLAEALDIPLEAVKGLKILEAGSGAGRFTEILLKYGAKVYSFDISNAVEANALNNKNNNLTLFQSSITAIPFNDNFFDIVICLGVMQHTENSKESLIELSRVVKNNGLISFDHYKRHLGHFFSMYLIYWFIIKNLPVNHQLKITNKLTKLFFPLHWYFRKRPIIQFVLRRISPISFYYGMFPLTKRQHYEFSLLDTHDKNTDHFKRHLSKKEMCKLLAEAKISVYEISNGGTGLLCLARNN